MLAAIQAKAQPRRRGDHREEQAVGVVASVIVVPVSDAGGCRREQGGVLQQHVVQLDGHQEQLLCVCMLSRSVTGVQFVRGAYDGAVEVLEKGT